MPLMVKQQVIWCSYYLMTANNTAKLAAWSALKCHMQSAKRREKLIFKYENYYT